MGVHAVRAALADAGLEWRDIQVAYGGSEDAGNADTMVGDLGPTGLPFVNVKNGCATGGSSLVSAVPRCESGAYEVGLVVGFDKHPRGAFQNDPADWSLPAWYGEDGLMVTTQFFGAKLQRYMHDHGIPAVTLAQVAEKDFANGSITPHAWRRTPLSIDEILGARDARAPADAVHALLAGRRRGGARRLPARVRRPDHRRAPGVAAVGRVPHPASRVVRGLQPVAARSRSRRRRPSTLRARRSSAAGARPG